jgi:hypothetical protein
VKHDYINVELPLELARKAMQQIIENVDTAATAALVSELASSIETYDLVHSTEPLWREDINYRLRDHKQFILDMEAVGFDVRLYHGRCFFHGPAVAVDDIGGAISKTSIECAWDDLGKGYIVYPKLSDSSLRNV